MKAWLRSIAWALLLTGCSLGGGKTGGDLRHRRRKQMTRCPNAATVNVKPAQCSDPYFETQVCDQHIADPGMGYKPGDEPPSHYVVWAVSPDEKAHCCAILDPAA